MSSHIVEICRIEEIVPIAGADKIALAKIKGWNCIVSKDKYFVNNLVVFIPPDSIIPEKLIEQYKLEFLKKDGRVKTIKLRGVTSQGLILDIPEGCNNKEGLNVGKLMGITKWEEPEPKQCEHKKENITDVLSELINRKISIKRFVFKSIGLIRNYFKPKKKINPYFDKYTDIENIKHFPHVFEKGENIVISEKLHGSNARFANLPKKSTNIIDKILNKISGNEYEFSYGSHNIQKHFTNLRKRYYKEDVWGKIVKKYNLETLLPKDFIFYGEIYGKGIQDLTYGLGDIDFKIFDIKNVKTGKYVNYDVMLEMCRLLNLPTVPILCIGQYS